jgi:autocrine motility factor receptor
VKISVSLSTKMGIGYGPVVALYTALSIGGIAWKLNSVLRSTYNEDQQALDPTEAAHMLQSLLQSSVMVALLGNLMLNFFLLITLAMKMVFFGQLSLVETQKVVERLINYVLFKGLFLTWVVRPEMMQIAVWLAWFAVLGFLKMFQGLARDRLERLNASPTATMFSHIRVFAVLLFVLLFDLLWMQLCLVLFKDTGTSTFLLLLFEPLSIAFDTLQAVIVHGMQLVDTWQRQKLDISAHDTNLQPSERSAAGMCV